MAPGRTLDLASNPFIVYCCSHAKPWPKYLFSVFNSCNNAAHVPCFNHSCFHKDSSGVPISKYQIQLSQRRHWMLLIFFYVTFFNVHPKIAHIIDDRLQCIDIEYGWTVAEKWTKFTEFSWPNAMNDPCIFLRGQYANVIMGSIHPCHTIRDGPTLWTERINWNKWYFMLTFWQAFHLCKY